MPQDSQDQIERFSQASTNELLAAILITLRDMQQSVSALQSEISDLKQRGLPVKNYESPLSSGYLSVWMVNK